MTRLSLLILAALFLFPTGGRAGSPQSLFPVCQSTPEAQRTAQAEDKLHSLEKERAALDKEVASAQPGHCGKDSQIPVHQKMVSHLAALHAVVAKVQEAANSPKLKGTKGNACREQLHEFLEQNAKSEKRLYETVEALCRN